VVPERRPNYLTVLLYRVEVLLLALRSVHEAQFFPMLLEQVRGGVGFN
jgi:hypothetical protein